MSEELARQLHVTICKLARRWARNHAQDTEDFAQDGVMAAIECSKRYPHHAEDELVKVCTASARNVIISNVRKQSRRGDVELEDQPVMGDAEVIAGSRELYLLVRSGLSKHAARLLDESLSPDPKITSAARGSVKDADYARFFGVSKPTVCRARLELRSKAASLGLSL